MINLTPIAKNIQKRLFEKMRVLGREQSTSTNTPNTMKAKLFVMDYHNIRGRTASEIAATPSIAWRATTS